MKSVPLVTIAIPTFNRAKYLEQTVQSALDQSYKNIEIIVADNCSSDNTEKIIEAFNDSRIKYYKHSENRGMVNNWNFCLDKANGEFFLLLSDDDILERAAVETFLLAFKNPSISLVYSRVRYIDEKSQEKGFSRISPYFECGDDFIFYSLKRMRDTLPSATLHRTQSARVLGGYPNTGTTTDLALRLELAFRGTVAFVEQPLIKYRVHEQSLSNASDTVILSHINLLNWADDNKCAIYDYRFLIKKYVESVIFSIGISEAVRGNKGSVRNVLYFLKDSRRIWEYRVLLYILSLPVCRILAKIRRAIIFQNSLINKTRV